jgi:hypothetical protein
MSVLSPTTPTTFKELKSNFLINFYSGSSFQIDLIAVGEV